MNETIDVTDITAVVFALLVAAGAGRYFADGNLIGATFYLAIAAFLGVVVLASMSVKVRRERERQEELEEKVDLKQKRLDLYEMSLESVEETCDRYRAFTRTLVRELDADPVPVELETRENGEVEVVPRDAN